MMNFYLSLQGVPINGLDVELNTLPQSYSSGLFLFDA